MWPIKKNFNRNHSCPDFLHGKESSSKEPKEKKKHKFLGAKLPKLKSSGHKSDQAGAQAQATAASTVGASRQSTASAPPLHTIDEVCGLITLGIAESVAKFSWFISIHRTSSKLLKCEIENETDIQLYFYTHAKSPSYYWLNWQLYIN